jgi:hypothetical protein
VNACVHTYTKPRTSSTRSRGLGRRIHGSVEDTKLSTNKQHSLSDPELFVALGIKACLQARVVRAGFCDARALCGLVFVMRAGGTMLSTIEWEKE